MDKEIHKGMCSFRSVPAVYKDHWTTFVLINHKSAIHIFTRSYAECMSLQRHLNKQLSVLQRALNLFAVSIDDPQQAATVGRPNLVSFLFR